MQVATVAATLRRALEGQKVCLMRVPLSWAGEMWDLDHPLDYLGTDDADFLQGMGEDNIVEFNLALESEEALRPFVLKHRAAMIDAVCTPNWPSTVTKTSISTA